MAYESKPNAPMTAKYERAARMGHYDTQRARMVSGLDDADERRRLDYEALCRQTDALESIDAALWTLVDQLDAALKVL